MTDAKAVFYYDFNSPYSYLAAERISGVFAEAGLEQPEWQPISFGHLLQATGRTPWSMGPDGPDPERLAEIQRRAVERGLPEVRYPDGWPVDNYSLNPLHGPRSTPRSPAGSSPSHSPASARCSPPART